VIGEIVAEMAVTPPDVAAGGASFVLGLDLSLFALSRLLPPPPPQLPPGQPGAGDAASGSSGVETGMSSMALSGGGGGLAGGSVSTVDAALGQGGPRPQPQPPAPPAVVLKRRTGA
jgi:hypothetical protein